MCPNAWRGTHTQGDIGKPSLMLQAVASYDLWIWNAYFGMQGSNNDINVFEASPVLEELISSLAPTSSFCANDNFYNTIYYLGDGIYPEYAIFVKTFTDPIDNKRKLFKKKQESTRKDIERAFGVLKKRWKVISNPARYWDKEKMQSVIYACIIIHNMILQDKDKVFGQDYDPEYPSLDPEYWTQETPMEQRIENLHAIKSRETHNMLMADLVDQVWTTRSRQDEPMPDLNEYVSDDED
uniref:protein ALP1-like n=1 Tax=Erigeron canadensis TaxID=72917 RepID=UPI001CB9938B|nr:protein ALP1-like [Erigeron canadensis]